MTELISYWIKSPRPHAPIGFGVTAYSMSEAVGILTVLGYGSHLPDDVKQLEVIADIKAEQIEDKYVLSHMGSISVRGIWYPFRTTGVPGWAEDRLLHLTRHTY